LGRKRVYLWGFTLFTVASVGCALAPSLGQLIALRAVQGVGAAMLQANSIALVSTSAPRDRLRMALGIQAAAQAVGLALGPTIGGLVVQTIGWRRVFAINVPVGVIAVVVGRYVLPRTRLQPGARQDRIRRIFKLPGVARGLAGALLAYLLLFGPIVLVPNVLQQLGESPLRAGVIVAALPIGFALAAALADRLVPSQWSTYSRCTIGLVLAGAGLVALLIGGFSPAPGASALLVVGLGLGLYTPANNATIMRTAPKRIAALAGGLVSAARAIGTAAGTLIVSLVLSNATPRWVIVALLLAAVAALATTPRASASLQSRT
jgi:MFS family permease